MKVTNMLKEPMLSRVISNKAVMDFCSAASALAGASVLVLGFRQFESLDFTEAQLFSAVLQTLSLAGMFVVMALVCHLCRRTGALPHS